MKLFQGLDGTISMNYEGIIFIDNTLWMVVGFLSYNCSQPLIIMKIADIQHNNIRYGAQHNLLKICIFLNTFTCMRVTYELIYALDSYVVINTFFHVENIRKCGAGEAKG